MTPGHLQQQLFQQIKERIPAHHSLADEVADVLHISIDSAYRRIRGEKPVGFEELTLLARHFNLSLDQFLNLSPGTLLFTGKSKPPEGDPFSAYLENVFQHFTLFNSFEKKHLYLLIKDVPPFVHFQLPELMDFKFYFWMKSILMDERFKGVKFSFGHELFKPYYARAEQISHLFNQVPMTEIWNIESINSTIRQINFFYEAGSFSHKKDVITLYEKTELLINHIEKQAELGVKFNLGSKPGQGAAEYQMFVNELILGDNTYLAELDGQLYSFLNHSVLYFIATRDDSFNLAMKQNLNNLMSKSSLISGVGEKDRVRFFNRLRDKIQARITALK